MSVFISIKDAWKAEKTSTRREREGEKCIPSVFLSIFGHKRFKAILNSAEPWLKRNIIHRQNKTHKFSDYPLLNCHCVQLFCWCCCRCCSFFSQNAHTDTERRMCPKPFERIADHKADFRLLFTCFFYHEFFLPPSFQLVYIFFFWLCLFRLFDQRREWRHWHVSMMMDKCQITVFHNERKLLRPNVPIAFHADAFRELTKHSSNNSSSSGV